MNHRSTKDSRPLKRPRAIRPANLRTFAGLPAILITGLWGGVFIAASATPTVFARIGWSALAQRPLPLGNGGPALERLRSLSERQLPVPPAADPALPPVPMLNPAIVARARVDGQADPDALVPLAEMLSRLATAKPAGEPLVFPSPTPAPAHVRSVQMYVRGRSKLLSGDLAGATSDLDTAARLDPQAADPWLALAEAQLMQGKRLSAIVSYQQAVRRGNGQARALWYLGRDALRNGKPKLAAEYLAQARSNEPEVADAALPYLVDSDLAEALALIGNLRAAGEALESALELPEQFGSVTRLRNELADLYRRRGELWRALGDLQARLGDLKASLEAYAESERVPMLDPGSILPRRTHALLGLGRPADAGLAVVEAVERAGWFADERAIAVCRYVARYGGLGDAFAEAIDEIAVAHSADASPSRAMSLSRLRAAAVEPERAREILRDALKKRPSDPAAIGELLALSDAAPGGVAAEAASLVRDFQSDPLKVAEALLDAVGNVDAIVAELLKSPVSDAAILLHAAILEETGRAREACWLISERAWSEPLRITGLAAQARAAMKCGRFGDAEAAYARLKAAAGGTAAGQRAVASAALDLQRPSDVLAPAFLARVRGEPDVPVNVGDCLIAATACLMLDRSEETAEYLNRATNADGFDERAYEGLFRVYAPPGERPDQEKIGEVARRLRQALPSARVLRLLTAQEMMQRQSDGAAEELLQGLVDERLSDATAGSALVTVWESRAASARAEAKGAAATMPESVARGEAWLQDQIERHPEHPWLWTGLARVLTVQGRPEEAERLLAARQHDRPWAQFGQMRETILRDWLTKPDEYAGAVRERLEPSPRGVEESLEFADFLIGQKKTEEAAGALRAGLPSVGPGPGEDAGNERRFVLTQDQSSRFLGLLARLAREWDKKPPMSEKGVSGFFELASEQKLAIPASLCEFRLRVLASGVSPDSAAITRALAEACGRFPGQSAALYGSVAAAHLQAGRAKEALPFLRSSVAASSSPSADLLFALVQQTAVAGDAQDFQSVMDQLTDPQQITALLKAVTPEDVPPTDPAALRGQLAYRIGTLYSFLGRDELSTQAKVVALKLNPNLAWAKNDLGYQMLEDGGDFAEAARLIEEAFAALPNEASIIDSIGWVRYHQGVLEDEPEAPGRAKTQGAITLLRRAVETGTGAKNGTLHDHLGEALWAAGRRDAAKEIWTKAEALLGDDVNQLKQSAAAPAAAVARANKELDSVRAKRRAAAEGSEPALTPMRSRKQAQLK